MFTRLFIMTLTVTGVATVAWAQPASTTPAAGATQPPMSHREINQAMAPVGPRHKVAIVDEYGLHYDSRGDRLDAAGHLIAPPHTLPGARTLP
jgi:hypothetical protein